MSKSNAKRSRNSFVRGVRAETAINVLTRALGYVQTRSHEQAVTMIQERIAFYREELADVHRKRVGGVS
jgi:hypothetical protein